MSKTKVVLNEMAQARFEVTGFKLCEKCNTPISYQSIGWKYSHCEKCSLELIEKLRKENPMAYEQTANGVNSKFIKRTYASGRRWIKDKCEICGYDKVLETHRFIPKKEGGTYTPENTVTLCPNCHSLVTHNKAELHRVGEGLDYIYELRTSSDV